MSDLAAKVIDLLRGRSESISCAESITGGALTSALVSISGASDVLLGSIVAYSKEMKMNQLGLSAELMDEKGLVSKEVALEMAKGARQKLGSSWAISSTGSAGPRALDGSSPGEIWIAIVGPDRQESVKLSLNGARQEVINGAVESALTLLERILRA
ncbi:MAG: CinA family protein [Candidatus Nanopelagicaceae bacterium]|nr:CinA family protein [Candidatus Nanopelagicaceae bacterium]